MAHLQTDNQRRVDRGDAPVPLDDTLTEALGVKTADLIQNTHWPNIDLIGAQLNLYWAEFQVPVWRMQGRWWKLWDALTDTLDADDVLDDYDLIFIDTPPALGYLTINGLAAADILLVPMGASFLEFDSTGPFFDMLHTTFNSIEEGENLAARALGREEMSFSWDAVRAVVTRYDGSQQEELAGLMQAYLGKTLSPHRQDFTALIGQTGEQVQGIYEADYRDFNRETYARGRGTFDATYAAFKSLLIGTWRRAVPCACGRGINRKAAVIIPNVPSEPIIRWRRSYPGYPCAAATARSRSCRQGAPPQGPDIARAYSHSAAH